MLPEKALYHGRATSMSESFYKTYQLQVSLTAEPTQFCEVWKIRRRSYTTPWNAEHLKTSSNDLPTLEDLGRSKRFFSQGENECGRCGAVFGTNFCPNSPPCRRFRRHSKNTSVSQKRKSKRLRRVWPSWTVGHAHSFTNSGKSEGEATQLLQC